MSYSPGKKAGGTLQEFMQSRHGNGVVTVGFCSKAVQLTCCSKTRFRYRPTNCTPVGSPQRISLQKVPFHLAKVSSGAIGNGGMEIIRHTMPGEGYIP